MLALNAIMVLISAGVLSTLPMMRDRFRLIEMIVYYMVIVIAIEQIHSAILDNFSLIKFSKSFSAFIFYKMNQLIVFPIGTLWLLFTIFHPKVPVFVKFVFVGVWFSVLSAVYILFQHLGIFKLTGWNFGYSIVTWYVVLIESLCFSLLFRNMLRKSEEHDPLPS